MFHLHLLLLFLVPSSTHSYFLNFDRFESWLEAYVQQEGISSVLVITEDTSDLDPEEHTVMHDIYFRLNSYGITFSALHVSSYNDSWNTDRDNNSLVIVFESDFIHKYLLHIHPAHFISNDWLILSKNNLSLDLYEDIKSLRVNSRFYVLKPSVGIFEIYRPGKGLPQVRNQLYDPFLEPLDISRDFLLQRRRNLTGVRIRVGYLNSDFFNVENRSGIFYFIFRDLLNNLNIKPIYILGNDGSYGTEVGGGEFDGLLGMVQKSEVDVSPQAFTMTEKRQKHITFSNFLIKTSWKLYLNDPGAIPLNWYSYLKVFHNRFWLGIIITILIFVAMYWLYSKRYYNLNEPLGIKPGSIIESFFAVFFAVLGSTFGSEIPTRTYFRILILTISLFGAILSWIFNATLVAILTSVVTKESVGSLKDLLERPEYQLILLNGTVVVDDFRYAFEIKDNPSAKLYQRVYTKLIEGQEEKVFLSEDKVIDGLRGTNRVVLYAEEFTTVLLLKDYPCSITEGKLKYGFSNLAWAFAPDFEYREMFDYEIRRLKEQGFIQKYNQNLQKEVLLRYCPTYMDTSFTPILFNNIVLVFIILVIGILVSVFVVLMEMGLNWGQRGASKSSVAVEKKQDLKKRNSPPPIKDNYSSSYLHSYTYSQY